MRPDPSPALFDEGLLRLFFILILLIGLPLHGMDWTLGLNNVTGRGKQQGLDYNYLENYLNFTLTSAQQNLRLEFEYTDPPEYGFARTGVRRIAYDFTTDDYQLTLGDLTPVFGRGVALNLYEDRTIDFDNIPQGIRFKWTGGNVWGVDVFAGRKQEYRFYSSSSSLREPDGLNHYDLAGIQLGITPPSGSWTSSPYALMGSFHSDLQWRSLDPQQTLLRTEIVDQEIRSLQLGVSQSIFRWDWDLTIDANTLMKGLDYPTVAQEIHTSPDGVELITLRSDHQLQGNGLYIQSNWYPEWFSALFEYKRYAYGRENLGEKRNPDLQATKPMPWIIGPTAIRQHDISLLGNVTHPVDYGDEVGWNLEIERYLGLAWRITLNATAVSQLAPLGDPSGTGRFWPGRDRRSSPWQEEFMEIEYTGEHMSNRWLLARTHSVLSAEDVAEDLSHWTLVPAYFSWHPSPILNLSTVLEFQWSERTVAEYGSDLEEKTPFTSSHVIASADYEGKSSFSLVWDSSDDPTLIVATAANARQHWVSGEFSYRPSGSLWVRASYGREKGGVRCTGGVCRVINPFEGARLSLEWRL